MKPFSFSGVRRVTICSIICRISLSVSGTSFEPVLATVVFEEDLLPVRQQVGLVGTLDDLQLTPAALAQFVDDSSFEFGFFGEGGGHGKVGAAVRNIYFPGRPLLVAGAFVVALRAFQSESRGF
ncbi:MAG: hypothetical protein QM749_12320 [Aquabacterium sp.]